MTGLFDNLVNFANDAAETIPQNMSEAQPTEASQMSDNASQSEAKDVKKDFYSKDFYDYYKR